MRGVCDRLGNLPNLKIAIFVQQDIGGLQVSVDDTGRVEEFKSAEHLVDEVLNMLSE